MNLFSTIKLLLHTWRKLQLDMIIIISILLDYIFQKFIKHPLFIFLRLLVFFWFLPWVLVLMMYQFFFIIYKTINFTLFPLLFTRRGFLGLSSIYNLGLIICCWEWGISLYFDFLFNTWVITNVQFYFKSKNFPDFFSLLFLT